MSVTDLKDVIADCIKKLRITNAELDFCHTQVVQSFAEEMNCKILCTAEYEKLQRDATQTASDIKAEVDKQLTIEVKILNSQLQHEIEKIRLTKDAEIDVLQTKLDFSRQYEKVMDHIDQALNTVASSRSAPAPTLVSVSSAPAPALAPVPSVMVDSVDNIELLV